MGTVYTTGQGDHLDLICQRHYGRQAGAVEQVLEANPTLAAVAHRLPVGLAITLPDLTAINTGGEVRLWT
jgi:phage tail protein X